MQAIYSTSKKVPSPLKRVQTSHATSFRQKQLFDTRHPSNVPQYPLVMQVYCTKKLRYPSDRSNYWIQATLQMSSKPLLIMRVYITKKWPSALQTLPNQCSNQKKWCAQGANPVPGLSQQILATQNLDFWYSILKSWSPGTFDDMADVAENPDVKALEEKYIWAGQPLAP